MSVDKLLIILKGGPPSDKGPGSGHYPRNSKGHIDFAHANDETTREYFTSKRDALMPTFDQEDALNYYSRDGFLIINKKLRGTDKYNQATPATSKAIKRILATMRPLTEDLVVYRGVAATSQHAFDTTDSFSDKGFVSTSLSPTAAKVSNTDSNRVNRVMSIYLPKGTPVTYGYYPVKEEFEVILPPESKFNAAGYRKDLDPKFGEVQHFELLKKRG